MYAASLFGSWLKWSESDIQPSMVTHTRNSCSAFNPSKCTHTAVHTHTPWTHTRSSGQPFMLWCPGSSWGFGALLKGTSVVVLKVEESAVHSLPPPTIPASPRLELATFFSLLLLYYYYYYYYCSFWDWRFDIILVIWYSVECICTFKP